MENDMDCIRIAKRCADALARYGISNRACTMVLFGMVWANITYRDALHVWAAYEFEGDWPPERWHSEICYCMVKAWVMEPAAQWFDELAREVCKSANRVYA